MTKRTAGNKKKSSAKTSPVIDTQQKDDDVTKTKAQNKEVEDKAQVVDEQQGDLIGTSSIVAKSDKDKTDVVVEDPVPEKNDESDGDEDDDDEDEQDDDDDEDEQVDDDLDDGYYDLNSYYGNDGKLYIVEDCFIVVDDTRYITVGPGGRNNKIEALPAKYGQDNKIRYQCPIEFYSLDRKLFPSTIARTELCISSCYIQQPSQADKLKQYCTLLIPRGIVEWLEQQVGELFNCSMAPLGIHGDYSIATPGYADNDCIVQQVDGVARGFSPGQSHMSYKVSYKCNCVVTVSVSTLQPSGEVYSKGEDHKLSMKIKQAYLLKPSVYIKLQYTSGTKVDSSKYTGQAIDENEISKLLEETTLDYKNDDNQSVSGFKML